MSAGIGPDDQVRQVSPEQWRQSVAAALLEHPFADSLHAVDEIGRPNAQGVEELRVVCRLVDWGSGIPRAVQLHTRIPRDEPVLDSLAAVAPGLVWHEREARDFFGIRFIDGDERPVIVRQPEGAPPLHPMRKDVVLAARVVQPWPGAKDPEEKAQASRRRIAPAGVPDPEVWGARPVGDPASAEEVVQAASGGRVRRRR